MSRTTSRVLWVIAGVLLVIAGIACLRNPGAALTSMTAILGIAMLFSGITKFVNSFDLQRLGVRGWGWFTAIGVLLACAGFFSFLSPIASLVAMTTVIGVFLVMQGIASIVRGCFSGRLWI